MIDKVDFDKWNIIKQKLHYSNKNKIYAKAGEIWYINAGVNIGFESMGKGKIYKRPILIIKKLGNMFLSVSMTTKGKSNLFYYKLDNKYFNKNSYLILSQVKSNDSKRFLKRIGELTHKDFYEIKKELKRFWF